MALKQNAKLKSLLTGLSFNVVALLLKVVFPSELSSGGRLYRLETVGGSQQFHVSVYQKISNGFVAKKTLNFPSISQLQPFFKVI